jgi:hypothetical protein
MTMNILKSRLAQVFLIGSFIYVAYSLHAIKSASREGLHDFILLGNNSLVTMGSLYLPYSKLLAFSSLEKKSYSDFYLFDVFYRAEVLEDLGYTLADNLGDRINTILEIAINNGANPNQFDMTGCFSLHRAIFEKNRLAYDKLILAGADLEQPPVHPKNLAYSVDPNHRCQTTPREMAERTGF